MARKVLANLDLVGNQILGLRVEVLAADPTGGGLYSGRLWFNSTSGLLKFYDGTTVIGLPSLTGSVTSDLNMAGFKVVNLAAPTNPTDAANKAYVDQSFSVQDLKLSVRAASVGNLILTAPQTVDGVSVVAGDRVLVKNQGGTASNLANGIYVVAAGAWTRAFDFDSNAEVTGGAMVFVNEGTANQNTLWGLINDDPITLGTTALAFGQVNNPGLNPYDLMMQGGAGVLVPFAKGANNTVLLVSGAGAVQYGLITNSNIDPAAGIALAKLAVDPLARSNHTGTQVAATISDLAAVVQAYRLDQFAAPTADVSLNNHKLTNVTDPSNAQDAATKNYVDALANGVDWKASVRVATTGPGALATAYANGQTVDGVVLATGNRILLKAQTAGAENGIYTVNAAGAPTRATDADANAEVTAGMAVFVSEGTVNGNSSWVLTTDDPIVIGTSALVFSQLGGAGAYTAGTGLSLVGSQFSLVVPVAVVNGGTGATTAAAARTSLGVPGKFAATIGTGAATSIAVAHNLGTQDVIVAVYETTGSAEVECDVVHTDANTVTLGFAVAPLTNALRCVVIG